MTKEVRPWTHPDNYIGEVWPDYYSSGFGRSRDSDALERSNFRVALAALGGESETVIIVRERHWAVGWVEWIAIHSSDEKALAVARQLCDRANDYPPLDEEDWSREEEEEAHLVWKECYTPQERIAYIRDKRSQFDFSDYREMLACVRGECFIGYASELLG